MSRSLPSLSLALLLFASSLPAGGKSTVSSPSPEVTSILQRESQSTADTDRRALLESARTDTATPEAWWQSGYVRRGDAWHQLEQVESENPSALKEYRARRKQARLTGSDQLKLADWCRDAGLRDQERVHLIQALSTGQTQNSQTLVRRLGYRQFGGRWYTDAELKATQDELFRLGKEWKRLSPKLNPLAAKLEGKPTMRSKGMAELRSLTARDALPILEFALAARSEAAASAVVEAISDVDSYRASQSLARLAIGSPWDTVRGAATKTLKQRPWEDFVPMTLAMMHQPIETQMITGHVAWGGHEWRFLFTREGRDAVELAAFRAIDYRQIANLEQQLPGQDFARANFDEYLRWLTAADAMNDADELTNQRIRTMLHKVTSLDELATPTEWWKWWDAWTDAPLAEPKSVVIVREDVRMIGEPQRPHSCLAAGTLVWTETGLQSIEKIKIGDNVLSKIIETGEMKFAPVLQTTHRENAPLTNITVGNETIAASAGHNFWISGRGWMRTNQLEDGMTAHTATGTATVRVEDARRSADVFNLVVDDAHTYFVGKSLLLGHDVLIPPPTDVVVPGLIEADAN